MQAVRGMQSFLAYDVPGPRGRTGSRRDCAPSATESRQTVRRGSRAGPHRSPKSPAVAPQTPAFAAKPGKIAPDARPDAPLDPSGPERLGGLAVTDVLPDFEDSAV